MKKTLRDFAHIYMFLAAEKESRVSRCAPSEKKRNTPKKEELASTLTLVAQSIGPCGFDPILYLPRCCALAVAEGRILSSDPEDFINDIPLGPNSVKVLVETAIMTEAFLWRPAPDMFTVAQAVGEIIAWPQCSALLIDNGVESEDIALKSPNASSVNLCKLMDWSTNDEEFVAEGRWQSTDPKATVNGLPLGPNAVKVFVDVVHYPDTFLWRPTAELSNMEDSLKSFVAWPVNRVDFGGEMPKTPVISSPTMFTAVTPPAPAKNPQQTPTCSPDDQHNMERNYVQENQKCILMDMSGENRVVAEGRWSSDDPDLTVHFVPLGHDGVRVWVDVVKWQEQAEKAVIETLGLGRTTQHLLVRLLRYWEVFSVNNPLHFKGIVLLMIDEQKCHVKKKDIRKFLD
ncbi:unnamed protein product, partial [Microthlaspi erraticum]